MDPMQLIIRWLHIGSVIVLVGGTFFMLFVLHPAASLLAEDQRAALRAAMLKRWKMVVHLGVLLLLVSGGCNYWFYQIPAHPKDGPYHALMGVKMLLGLAVMFIAELLVGRTKLAEKLRQQLPRFLAINLTLALVIILISGFLKVRGTVPPKKPVETAVVAPSTLAESKSDSKSPEKK